MKRQHISTTKRLAVFNAAKGVCDICERPIKPGQAWDISHRIPLALGGADDETNWFPAHKTCHRSDTTEKDQPNIAQAKAREARHKGAVAPSKHPFPSRRKPEKPKREQLPLLPRRPLFVDIT